MKRLLTGLVWILILPLIGCAIVPHRSIPIVNDKILIKISDRGASNWTDVPVAGYQVAQSHIVVVTKASTSAVESGGLFFGALGVLAIQLNGPEEGKEAAANIEKALQFDIVDEINTVLQERFKQDNWPPNWVLWGCRWSSFNGNNTIHHHVY